MAYKGTTLPVTCSRGGMTGAKNIDDIPAYMMVPPTRNIIFEKNGRRKRGGTSHLYANPYASAPTIIGLKHVRFLNTTTYLLAATSLGDIYSGGTTSINGAVKASGTITSNGTNVTADDTVTINGKEYKFKTALTPTEGEVLKGATAAVTLDNLCLAVNRTLPLVNDGVKYKIAAAHPTIAATTNTDTIQTLEALTAGTAGNSLTLTKSAATLTVSGATLSGGLERVALGTTTYYSIEMGEDKVFIADGVNIPHVWTGSGRTAQIHEPAADFTTKPVFQFLNHSRGLSRRMCALNNTTLFFSKTYAAALDMEHFITGGASLYLDTGDGIGLVGMAEVGSEIILFSKKQAWRVDDSDASSDNWGLEKAQWTGGVSHYRLLIKTPNDLIAMTDDGEVYSVTAVNAYGDYKAASVTRPSWMHDWIKLNVDLGEISQFHGIYDPTLKAIIIFVVRMGTDEVNTALLYYPDRDPAEAWMIHDNTTYVSGYDASVSCLIPLTDGSYSIYTGGYDGEIWKLNQTNRNDNSNGYYGGFKTPPDSCGDSRASKHFNTGRLVMEALGPYDIKARVWIGDVLLPSIAVMSMAGAGASLDEFLLDTDLLAGSEIIDLNFKTGLVGQRIQYEFFNDGAGEDFFISAYMTDFKIQGKKE